MPCNKVRKSVSAFLLITLGIVSVSCVRMREAEDRRRGATAAKMAIRYLDDAQDLAMKARVDESEFDRKWRGALQETETAKKAGLEPEIVDNLYCAAASFAGFVIAGQGLVEGDKCLETAKRALKEKYGL